MGRASGTYLSGIHDVPMTLSAGDCICWNRRDGTVCITQKSGFMATIVDQGRSPDNKILFPGDINELYAYEMFRLMGASHGLSLMPARQSGDIWVYEFFE